MKILLTLLGILVLLTLLFLLIGLLSPRKHEGKVSATFSHPPDAIWSILNDIEGLPDRRREIKGVVMMGTNDQGFRKWKELTDMGGYAIFEITAEIPNELIEVRMTESSFGISGTWTYEIVSTGNGTIVTIKEDSYATNLPVRSALSIAGRNATLKQELRNLARALEKK